MLHLQILWAFCVYLEAVSVLPQLRMMQKAKVSSGLWNCGCWPNPGVLHRGSSAQQRLRAAAAEAGSITAAVSAAAHRRRQTSCYGVASSQAPRSRYITRAGPTSCTPTHSCPAPHPNPCPSAGGGEVHGALRLCAGPLPLHFVRPLDPAGGLRLCGWARCPALRGASEWGAGGEGTLVE